MGSSRREEKRREEKRREEKRREEKRRVSPGAKALIFLALDVGAEAPTP
jgi:hypothetical protein